MIPFSILVMEGAREGGRKFELGNLDKIEDFFRPSTLKTQNFSKKNSRIGYVCIEKSFDTIFNIGGGWMMDRENRPWTRGLRKTCF